MFAYCNNDPVNLADTTGTFPWVIAGLAILGAIAVDHWVAANHPAGYAFVECPIADGLTDKIGYAEGNGFELDANGMTVCDVEAGFFSRSGEKGNVSGSIANFVTASAVAEFDWSGMPSVEASAMFAMYTNSFEATIPIGIFDVTIILEGHIGAVGAGIELDPDSGRFVITPPMSGVGCTYGVDLDIR